jgi:hypothetical protein
MTRGSLLVCEEVTDPKWQLPLPSAGRLLIVGWTLQHERAEAGVPDEVAAVLARALAGTAKVTFPSSSAHSETGETSSRLLQPSRMAERWASLWSNAPATFHLVTTREPEVAKSLFADSAFPWWLQGQIAILTPADQGSPDLDRSSILSAIRGSDWAPPGVTGQIEAIVRPGVDGDVMGVVALDGGFERVLEHSLRQQAAAGGFDYRLVSERDLTEELATGAPRSAGDGSPGTAPT